MDGLLHDKMICTRLAVYSFFSVLASSLRNWVYGNKEVLSRQKEKTTRTYSTKKIHVYVLAVSSIAKCSHLIDHKCNHIQQRGILCVAETTREHDVHESHGCS